MRKDLFGLPAPTENWYKTQGILISPSLGTVAPSDRYFMLKEVGNELLGRGWFPAGTTTASPAFLVLPLGFQLDYDFYNPANRNAHTVGKWNSQTAATSIVYDGGFTGDLFINNTVPNQLTFAFQTSGNEYLPANAYGFAASGNGINFEFRVIIKQLNDYESGT